MNFPSYQFIKRLEQLPFIDEIWLYGSRARGDNKERSDIDLAIICPQASEYDWLEEILEEADTLLKVDCVRFDTIDQHSLIYEEITRDHKLLYKKAS